uniref:Gamma carbonic anhydrase family protein n=1 Tax=candidate division WOR-3 bacterium TaxID=2052148 RepID=A0A7V4E3T2_UNCW3
MIKEFLNKKPKIDDSVYISKGAIIIGDVEIGKGSSVWFGTIIRGDTEKIKIGEYTNLQDYVVVHTDKSFLLEIGNYVTVGHRAIIHGCKINDYVMIGMGAIILNGAVINKNVIVAAGSVVKENFVVPENTLVAGIPAEIKRELSEKDIQMIKKASEHYYQLAKIYKNYEI